MPVPTAAGLAALVYKHPLYTHHLVQRKLASFARYRWAEKALASDQDVPAPLGYKLVLTYKCNLRCVMCYEWGEVGWCHEQPKQSIGRELDWVLVQKLVSQVHKTRPYFILHGGEPLLYSRFADLARLLRQHRCFSITCTNGLAVDRHMEVIAGNPYLTLLISLDGPERENDALRGAGVYKKVVSHIKTLKSLPRAPYVGIQFTIRPENVHTMYAFCKDMVALGVDWILMNPCWFISPAQAQAYERFMLTHFGVLPHSHRGYLMPYDLDKATYLREMSAIQSTRWPIQISCYLKKPSDIDTYIDTPEVAPGNTFCHQQWSRMDITPDGEVTPCILYPDLKVGNIAKQDILQIWNSQAFGEFRTIRRAEMLPVCAKCNSLYLHDSTRKYL